MTDIIGSSVIPCKDCKAEKARLEEGGVLIVVGCEQLPGQDSKPDEERVCRISWGIRGLSQ